jgi:hypothetical protein
MGYYIVVHTLALKMSLGGLKLDAMFNKVCEFDIFFKKLRTNIRSGQIW